MASAQGRVCHVGRRGARERGGPFVGPEEAHGDLFEEPGLVVHLPGFAAGRDAHASGGGLAGEVANGDALDARVGDLHGLECVMRVE